MAFIHLTTVSCAKNEHHKFAIVNFIDDAIVASSHSPFAPATH